jgi:hypothetical protein
LAVWSNSILAPPKSAFILRTVLCGSLVAGLSFTPIKGYTGDDPANAAAQQGIRLEVVKHHEAKRGFVLLPRRWVVELRLDGAIPPPRSRLRTISHHLGQLPLMLNNLPL